VRIRRLLTEGPGRWYAAAPLDRLKMSINAQLGGGIVGALVLWGTFSSSPFYSRTVTGLGADGYGRLSMIRIGVGGAFAVEMILTAIFVFIVLRVT
jgi:aquaporin Z